MTALAAASESLRLSLARFFRRHVRDPAEVDDLVQDVFARIASRQGEEPVHHLGGYAMRTAQNVLKDRARRRVSHHVDAHVEFDPSRHADADFSPEHIMAAREDLRAATVALLVLPERTRSVFLLFRLEGIRQKEIAQRLGISVSAVERHLVKALRHVGEALGRRE